MKGNESHRKIKRETFFVPDYNQAKKKELK